MLVNYYNDTIFSLSTSVGTGALAIIRVSGANTIPIYYTLSKRKTLNKAISKSVLTNIYVQEKLLDETLVTLFLKPHSFTKEDMMEISCHNSPYIIDELLKQLSKLNARQANAGEFTQRAYLNGRFDLAQAEAIADLIAADSRAAHQAALNQMRGGISSSIKQLRSQLIDFAALLELELDFGEEDVEFANRNELIRLINEIEQAINPLIHSFSLGNSLKKGIPIVIAGNPNVGKSTLLNTLLNEERAIVSDIPGTTRDTIEDELSINGIKFRLIDTAGLRETQDVIEAMGVKRTLQKMEQASVILLLFDPNRLSPTELSNQIEQIQSFNVPLITIGNKLDTISSKQQTTFDEIKEITWISASRGININQLKEKLLHHVQAEKIDSNAVIVTSARHFEHLSKTQEALTQAATNLKKNVSTDWISLDIREALHHLGAITGEITNEDILTSIFSKFCIGK